MNDLQKVEFELFKVFKDICEKLNLNYFMLEGSALGTARHGGFIPWDDDLDVGMYREDYNKFMEQAPAWLPEGVFLQNYKTDPEVPFIYAKLRNSNTTYIEKLFKKKRINHGVYIDIFPLDGYPSNGIEQKMLSLIKKEYKMKLNCGAELKRTPKGYVSAWVFRMLGYHKRVSDTFAKYEAFISKYSITDSRIICNHGSPYGKNDYILAEYYGSGTEMLFEGIKVRIPSNVDGYLTSLYGDWRTPPPLDKQVGTHNFDVCDIEKPYTYYTD